MYKRSLKYIYPGIAIIATSTGFGCNLPVCQEGEYVCLNHYKNTPECIESCANEHLNCPTECQLCSVTEDCIKLDGMGCFLSACKDNQWSFVSYCKTGFVNSDEGGDVLSCVDPCKICDQNGVNVNCNQLYDKSSGNIYTCDASGWKRDYSCTNDFTPTPFTTVDKDSFILFLSDNPLYSGEDLIPGSCGECSAQSNPMYCTLENDNSNEEPGSIYRMCKDGKWIVEIKDDDNACEDIKNKQTCLDNYEQEIIIDPQTNRYHCGACGHECHLNQFCENSECIISSYICDADNYTTINVGQRKIKAYCIDSTKTFIEIANQIREGKEIDNNYDHAYVLMDNIELNDASWTPIGTPENPFRGIIFGNSKKITIHSNIKQTKYMGLFGYIKNSHIEHLTVEYTNQANLDYTVSDGEIHFGGLTGFAEGTILEDVNIIVPNLTIDLAETSSNIDINEQDIKIGGMIGESDRTTLTNIEAKAKISVLNGRKNSVGGVIGEAKELKLTNCTIDVDVTGQNAIDTGYHTGTGGVIGFAHNIINFYRIKEKSEGSIRVTGYRNVGGLIGYIYQDDMDGELSNKKINQNDTDITLNPVVTGAIKYVGGLFGLVANHTNRLTLKNYNLGTSTVKLDGETDDTKSFVKPGKQGFRSRYFGGLFGEIYGYEPTSNLLTIEQIKLNELILDTPNSQCTGNDKTGKCSGYLGGFSGYIKNASINNIDIQKITFAENDNKHYEFRWIIGGIAGYTHNVTLSNVKTANIILKDANTSDHLFIYYVGGFVGQAYYSSFSGEVRDCKILTFFGNQIAGTLGYSYDCDVHNTTVQNLEITKTTDSTTNKNIAGLIAQAKGNTSVDNCLVENLSVTSNKTDNVGGLIGELTGTSTISNSDVQSSNITIWYSTSEYAGGLIGYADRSHVINSHVYDTFLHNSGTYTGGLVGALINGRVSGSTVNNFTIEPMSLYSRPTKSYERYVGGLIGITENSTIQGYTIEIPDSDETTGESKDPQKVLQRTGVDGLNISQKINDGTTAYPIEYSGGLIGLANNTTISDVFVSHATINNSIVAGGLVGQSTDLIVNNSIVQMKFSKSVDKKYTIGGLVGVANNKLSVTRATSILNADVSKSATNIFGGFFGNVTDGILNIDYSSSITNLISNEVRPTYGELIGTFKPNNPINTSIDPEEDPTPEDDINPFVMTNTYSIFNQHDLENISMIGSYLGCDFSPGIDQYYTVESTSGDASYACFQSCDQNQCDETSECNCNASEDLNIIEKESLSSQRLNRITCQCDLKEIITNEDDSKDEIIRNTWWCRLIDKDSTCEGQSYQKTSSSNDICELQPDPDPDDPGSGNTSSGETSNTDQQSVSCSRATPIFNDYTCSTTSFKETMNCKNTECDDLIKILCNGENTCDSFTLPLPNGVTPEWCLNEKEE